MKHSKLTTWTFSSRCSLQTHHILLRKQPDSPYTSGVSSADPLHHTSLYHHQHEYIPSPAGTHASKSLHFTLPRFRSGDRWCWFRPLVLAMSPSLATDYR